MERLRGFDLGRECGLNRETGRGEREREGARYEREREGVGEI